MSRSNNASKNNFILQGGILGIAGILTRIIGMLYRIPVTNIIGPKGNGYYAAAYQIYTIMLLISSYSLPLAVSKLVSARVAAGRHKDAARLYKGALNFAFFTGLAVCLLVFFGADFFAGRVMSEPLSGIALRVFAPTLLIVALMGVVRGYFQGLGTMVPTAVSQIIEQIINAVVSILAAKYLVDYGRRVGALLRNDNFGAAYGAAGSSLGTGVGALAGLTFLGVALLFIKRTLYLRAKNEDVGGERESYGSIIKVLLLTILPVILSTAIYNISELLSNSIFNKVMIMKGFEDTKSYIWGVYSGEYKILLNVPIALSNAMSSSVVPTLTSCMASGNPKAARRRISQVMRFMMMVAFPCAAGLCVLAKPIMSMLFKDGYEMAAAMMHLGFINIILYSVSTLSNGILQGINKMHIPVRNACIALVLHVGVLLSLLKFTELGIYSVIVANFCFAGAMSLLNHMAIRRYLRYRQEKARTFGIPAVCSAIMALFVWIIYKIFINMLTNTLTVIISMVAGAILYCVLLLRLRAISGREIKAFPMGDRILVILERLGLYWGDD